MSSRISSIFPPAVQLSTQTPCSFPVCSGLAAASVWALSYFLLLLSVSPLILLPGPVCTAHFSRMILMSSRISSIFPPAVLNSCLPAYCCRTPFIPFPCFQEWSWWFPGSLPYLLLPFTLNALTIFSGSAVISYSADFPEWFLGSR